jgi:hypothetical protein
MKTWTFAEARPPGVGPWNNEPDKVQWVDEETGYDCLILRHPLHGNLNGYVAVPVGHPAYGLGYEAVEVQVHGGLTFASFGDGEWVMADLLNRHPGPDRPTDVWWFGFDCHHAWDLAPTFAARMAELGVPEWPRPSGYEDTYKPLPYVVAECASLAKQLAAIGPRAIEA